MNNIITTNMKTISLFIILVYFISCYHQKNEKQISTFDLKRDYLNFKTKMTELDTLKTWMYIGGCTFHSAEKLTITKKGDSIYINPAFSDDPFNNHNYIKQKEIKIHCNDTVWKFENFLDKYISLNTVGERPIFALTKDSISLRIYSNGINYRDQVVIDYCEMMKKINPDGNYYICGVDIKIVDENKTKVLYKPIEKQINCQ